MTSILNNVAANASVLYVNRSTAKQSEYLSELSSGLRTVNAATDPAATAIGTALNSDAAVLTQATTNATNIQSVLNTADGSLAQIADILTQLKSLTTEAQSGTQTSSSLTNLDTEYQQLAGEIANITTNTNFNGTALLDGTYSATTVQVGTTSSDTITINLSAINFSSTFTSTLGDVSSTSDAASALTVLSSAINTVAGNRALVGAYTAQFQYTESVSSTQQTNIAAASSNYTDADPAQTETNYNNASTLTQAGIAALTQAQTIPQDLLRLLQA